MKETPALLAMTEDGRTVRAKKSGEGYTDKRGCPWRWPSRAVASLL